MGKVKYIFLLAIATFFYAWIARMYGIAVNNSLLFVCVLWIVPISVRLGKEIIDKETVAITDTLKEKTNRAKERADRLEDIRREKIYLQNKYTDLSKLYAITKEMSFNIRFTSLFKGLKSFLKDNFTFMGLMVALMEQEEPVNKVIDRMYTINEDVQESREITQPISALIESVKEKKTEVFLENDEASGFDFRVKNILALPLIVRKKIIAVIVVTDIRKEDRDKFLILAPQIALQIERIQLFDYVESLSIMDGLTQTFLRRYFLDRFKEEVARARQSNMHLSFVMVDLDYFKECNDSLGHLVGDVVLKEVAGILKGGVREIDFVARYGGEEFCILLPETNKKGAYAVAERIRERVEKHAIRAYDESVRITLSMGISSFPADSKELEQLIDNADKALYEAKRLGRNRVCVAPPGETEDTA